MIEQLLSCTSQKCLCSGSNTSDWFLSGPMPTAFTVTARMYTDITVLQMRCCNYRSLVAGWVVVDCELCIDILMLFPLHCTFSSCQLSRNVFMATDSIIHSLLLQPCQMCLNLRLSSISMHIPYTIWWLLCCTSLHDQCIREQQCWETSCHAAVNCLFVY